MQIYRLFLTVGAATILAGLVACGGGGQAVNTGPTVAISAANRDNAAHLAVAVGIGLGPALTTTNPSAATPPISAWLQPVTKRVMTATVQREYPQAVHGPFVYPCAISGTRSETIDDGDNDGVTSSGDVITEHYNNCQDTLDVTVNGTVTSTLTLVNTAPVPSGSARMDFSQLSVVETNDSLTFDGSMLLNYTQPSASIEVMRFAVESPMTVTVSTPGYSDTLTLLNGFVAEDTYDASLGRNASAVNGSLQSATLGGTVAVRTVAGLPITIDDTNAYPHSGQIRVRGTAGILLVTMLPADQVRLDLDVDNDGTFESRRTITWDEFP